MAAETNGSGLGGSSVFWANASPGKLFEQLAWGSGSIPVANPLVILDEVDKVNASQYNPIAALYSLLEVETASRFQDQAVPDVFLDLSKVRFILTANDQAQIPAPLLDRVRTFEIEPPSAEGMRKIAQRIFESLLFEYDVDLSPVLPAAVLNDIPGLGPRELKTRLEVTIAIAILDNQSELSLASWRQTNCGGGLRARVMGFV